MFSVAVISLPFRVPTPSKTSYFKPESLKFKGPAQHSLRHISGLITITMLSIFIMSASRLYRSKKTTIEKKGRLECVNIFQFCCRRQ